MSNSLNSLHYTPYLPLHNPTSSGVGTHWAALLARGGPRAPIIILPVGGGQLADRVAAAIPPLDQPRVGAGDAVCRSKHSAGLKGRGMLGE